MEVTYRCGNGHRNKVILQGNKDAHQKAPHHLETDGTQAAPENAVCPGEVNRTMTDYHLSQEWTPPIKSEECTTEASYVEKHFPSLNQWETFLNSNGKETI